MSLSYRFCRSLFRIFFRVYLRAQAFHAERVPSTGALLLAANHVSFLDPPLVGALCRRPIYCLGRKTLFRHWLVGWVFRSWNVVAVDRERGDASGMKMILRLLEKGKVVLIFPEGRRSTDGQLGAAQPGFGWLVAKSGATVLPVRVWGTDQAMPRGKAWPRPHRVAVTFGEPISFDHLIVGARALPGASARESYEKIGVEVMTKISQLTACTR